MARLLFIQPTRSSFMDNDYEILKDYYQVDRIILSQQVKAKYIYNLLIFLFRFYRYKKYDLFIAWFGDYHSALCAFVKQLLGKKMVLFIGGYDAVDYPEHKISVFNRPFRSFFVKYAIRHADLIIANHESLIDYTNSYIDRNGLKSGLKNIIKGFCVPYRIIYNGLNLKIEIPQILKKESKLVLTVGSTPTWVDIYNKGYDLLLQAARKLPDFRFVFVNVGEKWLDELDREFYFRSLNNVSILPFLPQDELYDWFGRAHIYAQPSMSEGMPNALMEAMLFRCVPIGSNVAGIPTLIHHYGVIINHRDVQELKKAIETAAEMKTGEAASEFIKSNFSREKRAEAIHQAIELMLSR